MAPPRFFPNKHGRRHLLLLFLVVDLPLLFHHFSLVSFLCFLPPTTGAFRLSSLFFWRSEHDKDDTAAISSSIYAYPRRDLISEYGVEGYKYRVAKALGVEYNPKTASNDDDVTNRQPQYGVDVSFPIHYSKMQQRLMNVFGDVEKQEFYDDFIKGCRDYYHHHDKVNEDEEENACDVNEQDRINMNLRQPQVMQNYTDLGFKKLRAPTEVMSALTQFWNNNKHLQYKEQWPPGNTYTNHWSSPTYMVSIENPMLLGGGETLKNVLWDAVRDVIQPWTNVPTLTPTSLYGIRIYKDGAVLAPHVDRLPLVSSAIINVAQDVDEPWPLEVYGHDGKAYNITMEPGDMILYESHSVIHGRPFPLRGRYYANVFVHFEPVGHSLRHAARMDGEAEEDLERLYQEAMERDFGEMTEEEEDELPPYIEKGTPEEKRWRQQYGRKRKKVAKVETTFETGSTSAHAAASKGDLERILEIAATNKEALNSKDKNGWKPLHEAARGGHTDIIEVLVEHGADVNERTNEGQGGTPLWWAETANGADHPVVKLLKKLGAVKIGPEL